MAVCPATCHCTAFRRVGHDRNLVAGLFKVGDVGGGFGHGKYENGVGTDHLSILCPISKGVAWVGSHS